MLYSRFFLILASLLILMLLPSLAFPDTKKTIPNMKLMDSVLSQADYFRLNGEGVRHHQVAIALYEQAAKQKSAAAQYWLGRMYFEGTGVEADSDKAVEWLGLAVKQDYSPAKAFLSEREDEDADEDC